MKGTKMESRDDNVDPLDEERSPTYPGAAEAAEKVVPEAHERAAEGRSPGGSADHAEASPDR